MRDETVEMVDTLVDVRQAMTQLTERQREVLDLWRQGYTQNEMAERLGCDQSTMCREMQHAVEMLYSLCA